MANRHISISMPVRVARDSKKKGTTRQRASEMLNQIKVPATQMQNKRKKKQKQKRKQYHTDWSRGSGKWGSPCKCQLQRAWLVSLCAEWDGMAKPWLRQRSVHTLQFICTYLLLLLPTSPSLSHSPLRVMRLRYLHLVLLINQFDLLN